MNRYERHFSLREIGRKGQRRLLESRVLVIGVGGLGSPVALYLSAAGVGTMGMVDFDRVEGTNLQRQVIYGSKDIGRKKLEAATERINDLNPDVEVIQHNTRLTQSNACKILKGYEVVVDCTDNIPARYLVNDAAHLSGIPDVYGSVLGFQGQVSVFGHRHGPCYRCLYPKPPDPGSVLSGVERGVLGVLPGLIGSIQAMEVVKVLLGTGRTLSGRLLLVDVLSLKFRELKIERDPRCPLCGRNALTKKLIDKHLLASNTRTRPGNRRAYTH
jgi:adenylyltransferase/sulfurtransferase